MKSSSLIRGSVCLWMTAALLGLGWPASAAENLPPAPPAAAPTTLALAESLLAEIKATPYAGRAALRTRLATAETRFGDKLPEWAAKKNNLPEKERLAAGADFNQLVRMREVLRQKIDGVENAEEATWNSAKSDLYSMLKSTVDTYNKLKARFDA